MTKRHKPKGAGGGNKRGHHGGRGRGNFRGGRGGGRGGKGSRRGGVWVDADEDPFIFDEAGKLGELVLVIVWYIWANGLLREWQGENDYATGSSDDNELFQEGTVKFAFEEDAGRFYKGSRTV